MFLEAFALTLPWQPVQIILSQFPHPSLIGVGALFVPITLWGARDTNFMAE